MEAKISIIIPAYNVAGYVEKCLDSLLAQTFQEYEVILVDDGSFDGTAEIVDGYANQDKRIQVIHKRNEGVSIARNTGITYATGQYILFFDGDDFVKPECLEELYHMAIKNQVDTLIYGYYRFTDGVVTNQCPPIFPEDIYEGESITSKLLPRFIGLSYENVNGWIAKKKGVLYVENPALWRVMLSTKVIKEHKLLFQDYLKVGEDTIFISEYLSHATRCMVTHACYYYLVTRESSTIYQYEKNPVAKLSGKMNLLDARIELTKKVEEQCGVNIGETWRGTVVMSCMELAFLMARKNPSYKYIRRYQLFKSYVKRPEVLEIIKQFPLRFRLGIKVIPFILLKGRLNFLLFICVTMLHAVHYEFQRN